MAPLWLHKTKVVALLTTMGCIALAFTSFGANPYLLRTFKADGRLIDEVIVPPSPPPAIKEAVVEVPEPNPAAGVNTIANVPAFTWCYGCSATSAGMMMGYYDNQGFPNMYTGPANGGVCPMNNETYWGYTTWPGVICGECPLVATHTGIDGRTSRGHVDDYWIDADDPGPDPYIVNSWAEHTQGDCTADFMGTSQSKFGNIDGSTLFYYYNDNSPLSDYIPSDSTKRDGCHGTKLFVSSRGYTITANYSQYIAGYNGISAGFSYDNFKTEIDAGQPVLIHLHGHTMLGYGYNDSGNIIYIHNTWDNSDHSMTWGGSYGGMQHCGVTVIRIQGTPPPPPQILAEITINNSHGPVVLGNNSTLSAIINLSGSTSGYTFDWWAIAETPFGLYYYNPNGYWYPTSANNLDVSYQSAIWNFSTQILDINTSIMPPGNYAFYFGVDTDMNGHLDFYKLFFDYVSLTIDSSGGGGISGTWRGTSSSSQVASTLDLNQTDSSIIGMLYWPDDDRTVSGSISGSQVTLYIEGGDIWNMVLSSNGNTMTGTGHKPNGGTYALNFHR